MRETKKLGMEWIT